MADGNVTTTTAAKFIPELWRDAILDYASRKFVLRNQVMDFSSEMPALRRQLLQNPQEVR